MGSHAAPRRGARRATTGRRAAPSVVATPTDRPGRRRAGRHAPRSGAGRKLVLGAVALGAAAAVLVGGQGSLAFWTDSATVQPGTLTAGKLDLKVDGADSVTAKTGLSLTSMVPGESVAANLVLSNAGNADFTWTPTVAKGTDALSTALLVEVYNGGTESGDDTTYPRTEGCSGTLLASGTTAPAPIRVGATQAVCVKITLPTAAGDGLQNATGGTATLTVAAQQVANP